MMPRFTILPPKNYRWGAATVNIPTRRYITISNYNDARAF